MPVLLHPHEYEQWLRGSFEDLLAFQERCFADYYRAFDGQRTANLISEEVRRSAESWERAWVWVAQLPSFLYTSETCVIDLVSLLCRQAYVHWRSEVADTWVAILRRVFAESSGRAQIRHCVQALQYSYRFTKLPLGHVVRTAFPAAYQVALDDSHYTSELGPLLSYSDWDRAKSLRESLVDGFMRSEWRPGDLALVAAKTFGLRKLYKRVTRKYRGETYMDYILDDLRRRPDDASRDVAKELSRLINGPYFYEPWV
jgi:hypothetical protein